MPGRSLEGGPWFARDTVKCIPDLLREGTSAYIERSCSFLLFVTADVSGIFEEGFQPITGDRRAEKIFTVGGTEHVTEGFFVDLIMWVC